jgi:uncharacterized protein YlxP (DUF503 family)
MVVGVARVVLHMPASHSLKDKRQVMKSLIAQVQQRFQIAAAEVEQQEQWQVGVIGLACVSNSAAHADEIIARAVGFLESRRTDAQVLDYATETLHV